MARLLFGESFCMRSEQGCGKSRRPLYYVRVRTTTTANIAIWYCDNSSVRTYGDCILCNRHLCAKHLGPEYHTCPKWEDEKLYDPAAQEAERREINDLLNTINIPTLLSRASYLRNGVPCSVPQPLQYDRSSRSSIMGGMNYHIEVQFEDGISWLARIRRFNATSPPPDLQGYIMRSEVATLRFLSKTTVPAPKVYDYNLDGENPIGVGYILMEKMAGKSLRWFVTAPEQRKKVMSQLADMYVELQAFPFDLMGSIDQPGSDHVGHFARESLTDYVHSQVRPIEPFTSSGDYLVARLRPTLDLIMRAECYAAQAVDAFLIHRFLLNSAPKILFYHGLDDGRFYLTHADDKGDHILLDDVYHITGK